MFIPYTPGSELAKKWRENEENFSKITQNKIKIVERTGTKLVDLLTKADPWKGADCQRENCLLCLTKMKTEKNKTQDCHKRNVVYETRCLTCERKEQDKIDNLEIEEQEKKQEKSKIKLYKYIGETSRSSFERGWEHVNDMAQLKTSSHMLKHALTTHQEQEMNEVQFGMRIIRSCQSSFERQVYESVAIQQERKSHHILNSRSEFNRCSLPRIAAQIGENEYEKCSEELKQEKIEEEKLEKMIIMLRKKKNKARLIPSKSEPTGAKRRKINDQEYISIKEIWGKPKQSEPVKNKATEQPEITQHNKKARKENWNWNKIPESTEEPTVRLTHCRTVENKPKKIENNVGKEGWQDLVDWNKVILEHRNRLEQEMLEIVNRYKKQNQKHESWELYRLCKRFLEQNNEKWNKRKEQEEIERNRIQRLEQARIKGISTRQKAFEKEQNEKLTMLPADILRKVEMEQAKEEKLELKMAKESLLKLRTTERKNKHRK